MSETIISTKLSRATPAATGFTRSDLKLEIEGALGVAKLQILGKTADQRFSAVMGAAAPSPGTQADIRGVTVAWLAPGEWLLTGPEALVAERLAGIVDRGGDDSFAVDLSHARTSFLLQGTNARGALSAHCPLDLWPSSFPVNAVARTPLGDTTMFIARLEDARDGPRFRIIVDQIMGPYAARMLAGPANRAGAHR